MTVQEVQSGINWPLSHRNGTNKLIQSLLVFSFKARPSFLSAEVKKKKIKLTGSNKEDWEFSSTLSSTSGTYNDKVIDKLLTVIISSIYLAQAKYSLNAYFCTSKYYVILTRCYNQWNLFLILKVVKRDKCMLFTNCSWSICS